MPHYSRLLVVAAFAGSALVPLTAAVISPATADEFARKVALIQRHGDTPQRNGARTVITQDELNSWFK
jgi:hypothetical protein